MARGNEWQMGSQIFGQLSPIITAAYARKAQAEAQQKERAWREKQANEQKQRFHASKTEDVLKEEMERYGQRKIDFKTLSATVKSRLQPYGIPAPSLKLGEDDDIKVTMAGEGGYPTLETSDERVFAPRKEWREKGQNASRMAAGLLGMPEMQPSSPFQFEAAETRRQGPMGQAVQGFGQATATGDDMKKQYFSAMMQQQAGEMRRDQQEQMIRLTAKLRPKRRGYGGGGKRALDEAKFYEGQAKAKEREAVNAEREANRLGDDIKPKKRWDTEDKKWVTDPAAPAEAITAAQESIKAARAASKAARTEAEGFRTQAKDIMRGVSPRRGGPKDKVSPPARKAALDVKVKEKTGGTAAGLDALLTAAPNDDVRAAVADSFKRQFGDISNLQPPAPPAPPGLSDMEREAQRQEERAAEMAQLEGRAPGGPRDRQLAPGRSLRSLY